MNLGSAYGEIQIGTGGAEQNMQGLADKLRGIGGAMSLAITTPLLGIATAAGMATAEFEQSLNTMQVVSGATAQEMAALQQEALRLGAETSFSAGEAAQGMLELAKAGLSTEQVMAAIGGTLDLAAAGGLDVAQAAEIAANAVNTFGLEASDTVRVADILAAAANASSVEVTDMAQGMTMAGAVFAANKVPIEDLSTAIALLGNNGIKGSDAGTSLKTMLMRLTAPTKEASGAMRDLGIEVYNSDGSMRTFEDIVGQLERSTTGLTDAQRNQALTTIFGADAIRAANILVSEGSVAYAAMKNQVTEAGAAGLVADSKLKGLAGAIEYAKGSIESALITAFLPFTDAVGGMIRQAADLVTAFTELPEPVRNAALAFAAVLAAAGPVMLAISGIGATLAFLLSPIGLIVVGVAALAAAWASNFLGIQEATAAAWGVIQPVLAQVMDGFSNYALSVMDAGFGSMEAAESISLLPAALQPAALAFDQAAAAIQAGFGVIVPQVVATVQAAFATAAAAIQAGFGVIVPQVVATVQAAWDALMALLAPALERLQAAFATAGTQVAGLAPHFEGLLLAVGNMWVAVQPILEAFGQLVGAVIAVAAVLAVNGLAQAFANFGTVAGAVLDQITLTINTFAQLLTEAVALVRAVIDGDWTEVWRRARNIFQIFNDYFVRTFENLTLIVQTVFTAIQTAVIDTLKDLNVDGAAILNTIKGWWDSIWGGFKTVIDPIVGAINGILGAMQSLSSMNFTPPWEGLQPPSWWNPGGWFGGGGEPAPGQNARGTSFWPGGLSWVGERGPELVDLPRGARVYDAQESQRMAAAPITINVPVQTANSNLDLVELAHRVAGVIVQYQGA